MRVWEGDESPHYKPSAMLRRDSYKLHYSPGDPPQLYDLAQESAYQSAVEELTAQLLSHWDPGAIEGRVRQSQRERRLIERAYRARGSV